MFVVALKSACAFSLFFFELICENMAPFIAVDAARRVSEALRCIDEAYCA